MLSPQIYKFTFILGNLKTRIPQDQGVGIVDASSTSPSTAATFYSGLMPYISQATS